LGKRCSDLKCPYLAADGTCLLSETELKEKCPARESMGHEEKDEWIDEHYVRERLKSIGVIQ
jgi:hypothetical protein